MFILSASACQYAFGNPHSVEDTSESCNLLPAWTCLEWIGDGTYAIVLDRDNKPAFARCFGGWVSDVPSNSTISYTDTKLTPEALKRFATSQDRLHNYAVLSWDNRVLHEGLKAFHIKRTSKPLFHTPSSYEIFSLVCDAHGNLGSIRDFDASDFPEVTQDSRDIIKEYSKMGISSDFDNLYTLFSLSDNIEYTLSDEGIPEIRTQSPTVWLPDSLYCADVTVWRNGDTLCMPKEMRDCMLSCAQGTLNNLVMPECIYGNLDIIFNQTSIKHLKAVTSCKGSKYISIKSCSEITDIDITDFNTGEFSTSAMYNYSIVDCPNLRTIKLPLNPWSVNAIELAKLPSLEKIQFQFKGILPSSLFIYSAHKDMPQYEIVGNQGRIVDGYTYPNKFKGILPDNIFWYIHA